jgi:hypothetical protein
MMFYDCFAILKSTSTIADIDASDDCNKPYEIFLFAIDGKGKPF